MPESPFTGLTASLKINGVILGYVSGVDLSLERDIIEILSFGSAYKEKVPSIKDWSVSIDGTLAIASGGTQASLYNAFNDGSLITLGIFLDTSTYFEGGGYASSFSLSAAPDDKISLTSEIAGSGAITLVLGTSITMSKYAVAITGTGTATSTVTGATGTVNVSSSNTAIATVAFETGTVTVTGVSAGVCTVFINDMGASGTKTSTAILVTVS